MRVAVRRLPVEDVEKLQKLVVENFDAIEPGLTVLDTRLLLGHATIDVIGTDTAGALVLGTVAFSANEEMLLKAVEAYSWCLEYPQALARLYPSCQLSEARPPRLLFVVERMPDAFHRKIKQFGFPEVDCMEFRHLEFDGTPAVYFDSLLRLRRHAVPADPRAGGPEATAPDTGGVTRNGDHVVALNHAAVPAPAPVVSMASRPTTEPAPPRVPPTGPTAEPAPLSEPERLVIADPVVAALELDTVVASLSEPVAETSVAPAAQSGTLAEPSGRSVAVDAMPAIAPPHVVTATTPVPESVSVKELATALLGVTTETQEAVANAVTAAMATPDSARSGAIPTMEPPAATVEPLESPAATPVEPRPAAPTLPQGFEGLKFPNDGMLTRQWMEFLSQMSATK
jgi:hypothetical protein